MASYNPQSLAQKPFSNPEYGFMDVVSDQFMTGWLADSATKYRGLQFPAEQGYVWSDHVPPGYEQYASDFAHTESRAEAEYLKQSIDRTHAAEGRLSNVPFMENLAGGFVAGFADPLNYVAMPVMRGVGFAKGALRGSTAFGGVAAFGVGVESQVDPTLTLEQGLYTIGGAALLGAVGGGGVGKFMSPMTKVRPDVGFRETADRLFKAFADSDGMIATEAMDINGLSHKVSFGNVPNGRIEIRPAREASQRTIPLQEEQITPEINDPIYHGTRENNIATFVDGEGNLILRFSENFGGRQVGVSFTGKRDVAVRYANEVKDLPEGIAPNMIKYVQKSDPTQGIIFAIDRGAVPDLRVEAMDELFHMTDQDLVIPAGKWRAEKPTPSSNFTEPPYYIRMNRNVVEDIPAREAEIVINDAAILAEYDSEALRAEFGDIFKSKWDWLNFNVQRALQERVNPRMAGEDNLRYQDRITQEALTEYKAGKMPLNPASGLMERAVIAGTFPSIAMKLFGDDARLFDSFLSIAGDHATLNAANRAGKATPDSVHLAAQRKIVTHMLDAYDALQKNYAAYLRGGEKAGDLRDAATNMMANIPVVGRSIRQGKMTRDEFNEMVGYVTEQMGARRFRGREIPSEVREAARVHNAIYKNIEEEARALGMFDQQRVAQRTIAFIEGRIEKLSNLQARFRDGHPIKERLVTNLNELRMELDQFRQHLDELASTPVMPAGVRNYFPHVFRYDVIKDRREEFTEILTRIYQREVPNGAADRARKTVARMLGEIEEDGPRTGGSIPFLKGREIHAGLDELADFVEINADTVMRGYLNRFVPAMEMTRRFGDRFMTTELANMRDHLYEKLGDMKDRKKAAQIFDDTLQLMEDARDRVLGNFGTADTMEFSARTARLVKNFANLTLMGSSVFAAMSDVGTIVKTLGPNNVFKGIVSHFNTNLSDIKIQKQYAKAAGEAAEILVGHHLSGLTGTQSIMRPSGNIIERAGQRASDAMFFANLLTPWTVMTKEFVSLVSTHVLIDDAKKVAAAIQAGQDPSAKMVARLASVGISPRDAQLIASMPIEKGNSIWLANMTKWSGREGEYARQKMLGAIAGEIKRSVITPGPMDRPRIFDGVIYKRSNRVKIEQQIQQLHFDIEVNRNSISDIRTAMRGMSEELRADAEAQITALVEKNREKGKEIGVLRSGQARAARVGSPLLALPFQFMAFPFAAASKLTHSTISGRDRAPYMGLLALFAFAHLGNKMNQIASGSMQEKSTEEEIYEAFDRSGIAFWLSNIGATADTVLDMGPRAALGLENPFRRPGDIVGRTVGAGPGMIYNFGDALFNPDYGANDRGQMLRRSIPFNNLFWFKRISKELGDGLGDMLE